MKIAKCPTCKSIIDSVVFHVCSGGIKEDCLLCGKNILKKNMKAHMESDSCKVSQLPQTHSLDFYDEESENPNKKRKIDNENDFNFNEDVEFSDEFSFEEKNYQSESDDEMDYFGSEFDYQDVEPPSENYFHPFTMELLEVFRKGNVNNETIDGICKLLRKVAKEKIDLKNIPTSSYELEKIETQYFPGIRMKSIDIHTSVNNIAKKKELYYYDLEEILKEFLKEESYKLQFNFENTTEKSEDFQFGLFEILDNIAGSRKCFAFKIFLDKFISLSRSKKQATSIYLTSANITVKLQSKIQSKIVLTIIPPDVSDTEMLRILDLVFVTPLLQIEDYFFNNQHYFVTLHSVDADHNEKVVLAGTGSVKANLSCVYGLKQKSDFKNLDVVCEKKNAEQIFSQINDIQTMKKEHVRGIDEKKKKLWKNYCVRTNPLTPFWKIKSFRIRFYDRYGICQMHLIQEGLAKNCILWTVQKYWKRDKENKTKKKKSFIYKLNQAYSELVLPRGTRRTYDIVKEVSRRDSTPELRITCTTAEQIETFLTCSIKVFENFVSEDELNLFFYLDNINTIMNQYSFSDSDYVALQQNIDKFRVIYVKLFESDHSLQGPNFETLTHLVDTIKFLGTPRSMNTRYWDMVHLSVKHFTTNNINPEKQRTVKFFNKRKLLLKMKKKKLKAFKTIGKNYEINLKDSMIEKYFLEEKKKIVVSSVNCYHGIWLRNGKLIKDDFAYLIKRATEIPIQLQYKKKGNQWVKQDSSLRYWPAVLPTIFKSVNIIKQSSKLFEISLPNPTFNQIPETVPE